MLKMLGKSLFFIGLVLMGVPSGLAKPEAPALSVLAPFEFLTHDVVSRFRKESGASLRTGFLSTLNDTLNRVRLGNTVWDVVISDFTQLTLLQDLDRLQPLGPGGRPTLPAVSGKNGKVENSFVSLLADPLGLICRVPRDQKDFEVTSWLRLSESLVAQGITGEVVLMAPLSVQVLLAHAVQEGSLGDPETRVAVKSSRRSTDARVEWLQRLHWQTRAATVSLKAEVLSEPVSCVVSFLSKFWTTKALFAGSNTQKIVFVVPGRKTIVKELGAAITTESPRIPLARHFVSVLVSRREDLVKRAGMCVYPSPQAQRNECRFQSLGTILRHPSIAEGDRKTLMQSFHKSRNVE